MTTMISNLITFPPKENNAKGILLKASYNPNVGFF